MSHSHCRNRYHSQQQLRNHKRVLGCSQQQQRRNRMPVLGSNQQQRLRNRKWLRSPCYRPGIRPNRSTSHIHASIRNRMLVRKRRHSRHHNQQLHIRMPVLLHIQRLRSRKLVQCHSRHFS